MDDNTLHFIQFTAEPRKTMIHTRQLNSIKILNDAFLTHKLVKKQFYCSAFALRKCKK